MLNFKGFYLFNSCLKNHFRNFKITENFKLVMFYFFVFNLKIAFSLKEYLKFVFWLWKLI